MSNKIVNTIGALTLVGSVIYLFKKINQQTETKLISNKALDVLQKEGNIKKLNKAVSEYHKNGTWNEKELDLS